MREETEKYEIDLKLVSHLLKSGVNVNHQHQDYENVTIMYLASANRCSLPVLKTLIEHGANYTNCSPYGSNILMTYLHGRNNLVYEYPSYYYSPYHSECTEEFFKSIQQDYSEPNERQYSENILLDYFSLVLHLNHRDNIPPISEEIVEYLASITDTNQTNDIRFTSAFYAAINGCTKPIFEILQKYGADLSYIQPYHRYDYYTNYYQNVLRCYLRSLIHNITLTSTNDSSLSPSNALSEELDTIRYLASCVDLESVDGDEQNSVLNYAATIGSSLPVLKTLIELGSDPTVVNVHSFSVLMNYIYCDTGFIDLAVVDYLAPLVDLEIYNDYTENTVLHMAAQRRCKVTVFQTLIHHGANYLYKNKNDQNILVSYFDSFYPYKGEIQVETISYLCSLVDNVDFKDKLSMNALCHAAFLRCDKAVFEVLLKAGCDFTLSTRDQKNVVMLYLNNISNADYDLATLDYLIQTYASTVNASKNNCGNQSENHSENHSENDSENDREILVDSDSVPHDYSHVLNLCDTSNGYNALLHACKGRSPVSVLKALVNYGADVEHKSLKGDNMLHCFMKTCVHNHNQIDINTLAYMATICDVNSLNKSGDTIFSLYFSKLQLFPDIIDDYNLDLIDTMLYYGANVNHVSSNGKNGLMAFMSHPSLYDWCDEDDIVEVVDLLISRGTDLQACYNCKYNGQLTVSHMLGLSRHISVDLLQVILPYLSLDDLFNTTDSGLTVLMTFFKNSINTSLFDNSHSESQIDSDSDSDSVSDDDSGSNNDSVSDSDSGSNNDSVNDDDSGSNNDSVNDDLLQTLIDILLNEIIDQLPYY